MIGPSGFGQAPNTGVGRGMCIPERDMGTARRIKLTLRQIAVLLDLQSQGGPIELVGKPCITAARALVARGLFYEAAPGLFATTTLGESYSPFKK